MFNWFKKRNNHVEEIARLKDCLDRCLLAMKRLESCTTSGRLFDFQTLESVTDSHAICRYCGLPASKPLNVVVSHCELEELNIGDDTLNFAFDILQVLCKRCGGHIGDCKPLTHEEEKLSCLSIINNIKERYEAELENAQKK